MATCDTPDLGRIKAVGLFLLDDCLAPIYDLGAGYVDDCPANVETSDNLDNAADFTRRCADGTIKRFIKGATSLQDIDVSVDFHWLDPDWIAQAGGATAILHNGDVIGWSDGTANKFNVAVVIWQELLGSDACDPTLLEPGCNDYVRIYPLKGARVTEEGAIGGEDSVIRITGSTSATNALGSGPIPLACDPATGDAEWLSDCLVNHHRYKFIGGPAPTTCGVLDTEAPLTPCVAASA